MWRKQTLQRILLTLGVYAVIGSPIAPAHASNLPYPDGLRSQVEFWVKVFAVYSRYQVLIHDTWHLDSIYSVLDFRELAGSMSDDALSRYIEERSREEKDRIRAVLIDLHQRGGAEHGLTAEERRLRAMVLRHREPTPLLRAADADRIRGQRGLRERFADGIQISRRYLPEMERLFRAQGLPVELTRLPLVESCFQIGAHSKAGAAGIWQFMPATGREYMRVDDQVDERRDPLLATAAAAALLKRNYEVLGDWPLAVTAYNHGRAGMVRAVDAVGSRDLVKIIRHYQGPGFKFASRNFYAELLAAVQVDKRYREYFGELNMHQPVRTDSVTVPQAIPFSRLASSLGVDSETMASHNPALTPAVLRGRLPVPRGYRLRLPAGVGPRFASRLAEPPASSSARARDKNRETRLASNPARSRTHRVAPGQTLSGIAKKYGTSVAAIERHNNLRSGAPLRVGRRLVIPVTSGS